METYAALAAVFLSVLLICGCAQPSGGAPTPVPTTIKTVRTLSAIPTITSTLIPVPTKVQTATVSDNTISILDDSFDPNVMTVKAGATVRWVNLGTATQRIKFADGSVSQLMSTSQSWSKIFNDPGIYQYSSAVNTRMQGTVRVV